MHTWQERFDEAAGHIVPFLRATVQLDGARVVEFGSGNGAISCALAPFVGRIVGVDILDAEIEDARRRAGDAGHDHLRFESGAFEALIEHVRAAGDADVFLLYAVLEHMTVDERLATLRLAQEVLVPDGVVCVFETPNRLLWWDHHTTTLPFFGMLPDDLLLQSVDRIPRANVAAALHETADDREIALTRFGRGASQHEFELVFGPLAGKVVAGGYDPMLLSLRHVHREELALDRFMRTLAESPSPVFSRYWLDLVLSPNGSRPSVGLVEPWPFSTLDAHGVAFTPWQTLRFVEPGAQVRLPVGDARALVLGLEVAGAVDFELLDGEVWIAEVEHAPGQPRTAYTETPLPGGCASVTVRARAAGDVSFIGLRRPAAAGT